MGRTERVVYKNFSHRSELFRKLRVVLCFARHKAHILKQLDVAILKRSGNALRAFTDYILCHFDILAELFGKVRGNRLEGIFHVELALRAAEM